VVLPLSIFILLILGALFGSYNPLSHLSIALLVFSFVACLFGIGSFRTHKIRDNVCKYIYTDSIRIGDKSFALTFKRDQIKKIVTGMDKGDARGRDLGMAFGYVDLVDQFDIAHRILYFEGDYVLSVQKDLKYCSNFIAEFIGVKK
jgi:prepilin signal peptidase PulO-like enzyme (type II secretory pathway)